MKIGSAKAEAFSVIRRRALARASAQSSSAPAPADQTVFLGLDDADLTPAVQAALKTLLGEIDDLRGEVARLKAHLAKVEDLADQDVLTPILNRRAFMRELHRVTAYAARYGAPASVCFFDMDGFKGVNDRFGHAAGDLALKAVADRLLANTRDSDVVGRLGGDEFGVILVQADEETARAKGQALKRAIEAEPVDLGDWSLPLHVSVGVRQIDPAASADVTLAEADAVMFLSKRTRRSGEA